MSCQVMTCLNPSTLWRVKSAYLQFLSAPAPTPAPSHSLVPAPALALHITPASAYASDPSPDPTPRGDSGEKGNMRCAGTRKI